jgi:adenylate cyclase
MANEMLELGHRVKDPAFALQAHQALGMTAFCRGQPATAVHHVEQTTALYDPGRHSVHAFQFGQDPATISKAFGAVALWLLGYPDQARRQSAAAITASENQSPSSQAVALHFAAVLHQLLRDGSQANAHATASRILAAENGFSFWLAGGSVLAGWGLAACGHVDDGVRQLRKGLVDWSATGSVTYRTYYLGLLAEVLVTQGQTEAAKRALEEALALVEDTDERLYEAELYRLRGELRIEKSTGPEAGSRAEEDFSRALDITRGQGAKSLELRAATSMARRGLLTFSERRELLASTFGWFREGLDSPDLRDAKELLEHLT